VKGPEFVTPAPTRYEGNSIIMDDGYRSGVKDDPHGCGFDDVSYWPWPVDVTRFGPDPRTVDKQTKGWWCAKHGPLEESEALNHYFLFDKCFAWLFELALAKKIREPHSGTHGLDIATWIMQRCVEAQRYDDEFIEAAVRDECGPVLE